MSDEPANGSSNTPCSCESCPQNIRILLDDSSPEFFNFLDYHARNYQQQNPHISITIKTALDIENELLNSKDWDGSIFPAQLIGSLSEKEVLWDLGHFIRSSSNVAWTELLPFFRNPSSVFYVPSDKDEEDPWTAIPYLIPLDGDLLSMYYRKDLFEQYNMTIPRTWEEYGAAASFFDGMPLGPGGSEIAGSCVSRIDRCANEYWASLILASMTQAFGTSSGFFLNPSSLEPLFGKAMEETLRIIRNQFAYGHDEELTGDCLASNLAFNQGNCALTYNWGNQIIVSYNASFDFGVAATPGSQVVLDRHSGMLVNCTPSLCPHAVHYDDIGLVNQAPYAAFGGWVSGVSSHGPEARKYAVADFLAYMSNSRQSLDDILPNSRSSFGQPYRYDHVKPSNWIEAGLVRSLAWDYTEAVRKINSENSVLELRLPSAARMRDIVDQGVFDYLVETVNAGLTPDDDLVLRRQKTLGMERSVRDIVKSENRLSSGVKLSDSYRQSIGYTQITDQDSLNYINEDFRDAAWGLSGLMCVTCVSLMIWTLRHRNNRVMKAFQPFLLFQSTSGLLLMSASIIPLGFDDSWYEADLLDITCMISPWLYIVGFTIFFSSVYVKIRECINIYRDPRNYSILLVKPYSCLRLCTRLLLLNGTILGLWTGLDPLKWERQEIEGGIVLDDGTVETYGACRGGYTALAFSVSLYALNMLIALTAALQAFRCRFLVLEYNEMQWLPLSVFPFVEVWLIGGPILPLVREDPTVTFVVLSMMIVVSTVVGGMAVFAPKDWYIRKFYHSNPQTNKRFLQRTDSAGIMVLQHPTVESQKQIEDLSFKVEQVEGWNTELEIEIRLMKEKFKELTRSEKFHIRESLLNSAMADIDTPEFRSSKGVEDFEPTEISKSNDEELAAVEQFQQVWKMPDDDEEEENHAPVQIPKQSSFHSLAESLGLDEDMSYSRSRTPGVESAPDYRRSKGKPPIRSRAVPQAPDTMSETSSEPLDGPHAWTKRVAKEENESPHSPPRVQRSTAQTQYYVPQDPLATIAMMDEESNAHSREPSASNDSVDDPSVRLAALDNNSDKSSDQPPSNPQKMEKQRNTKPERREMSDKDIIARIIAMKLAASERDEDGNDSTRETPEDPLERIMNMNAEEQLISAASLMRYLDPEDDDDNDTAIIKKKDYHDLSSMIEENDLEELERRAATLAESVKTKLTVSSLADLTRETETTVDDSDTGMGYLALATGGLKDTVNTSQVMNGLDISKISNDDDGDRRFVSMSDSILDSPGRNNTADTKKELFPASSNGGPSSHASKPSAGQSSADSKPRTSLSAAASAALEQGNVYATQLAGEPSQGESGGHALRYDGNLRKDTINDEGFRSPTTPTRRLPGVRKFNFQEEGSPVQNRSYSISDWAAVGGLANVLADWSDSQSSTSYAESIPESSVASFEATTRASALETPMAKELDQLVGTMDWDGVKAAADKYETKVATEKVAPAPLTQDDSGTSTLAEKRKKKRELEAWKNSLTKSLTKGV